MTDGEVDTTEINLEIVLTDRLQNYKMYTRFRHCMSSSGKLKNRQQQSFLSLE